MHQMHHPLAVMSASELVSSGWSKVARGFQRHYSLVEASVRVGSVFTQADDDDLEARYRALSPWLARILRQRFGLQNSDVEDLVQEAFIRMRRYAIEARSQHPRSLLLRIASNLAKDDSRGRTARLESRHEPWEGMEGALPARLITQSEQEFLLELKRAILELPSEQRDTFLLARFTPMTNAEIAVHQGISTKTVEWRIRKAVASCMARLGR